MHGIMPLPCAKDTEETNVYYYAFVDKLDVTPSAAIYTINNTCISGLKNVSKVSILPIGDTYCVECKGLNVEVLDLDPNIDKDKFLHNDIYLLCAMFGLPTADFIMPMISNKFLADPYFGYIDLMTAARLCNRTPHLFNQHGFKKAVPESIKKTLLQVRYSTRCSQKP